MRSSRVFCAAIALVAVLAGVVVAIALYQPGSRAMRRGDPLAMLEADIPVLVSPAHTLRILRSLGVGIVRLSVSWSSIAPNPGSRRRPVGFDAADNAAYPAVSWTPYDAIVRRARADGIEVDFVLTGDAPLWAAGRAPAGSSKFSGAWEPSAGAYGQFVRAIGTRYSGRFTPAGASSPLPGVHFWELWNEPNWGPSLQPQIALHPLRIVSAPKYRRLVDEAWNALRGDGHRHDTVVIGSLSPRGVAVLPGSALAAAVAASGPLGFTRALYCVDSSDHPLRGSTAMQAGCPTTAAGSRRFRGAHPALFEATGFGIHPYPINLPPTEADTSSGDTVEFSQIPDLANTLDRLQRVYGSVRKLPIYNTEFGYITRPPNPGTEYVSPSAAARYLNWAEYLTWRNPRIATTTQFLLNDPSPGPSPFGVGGFASGLIFSNGKPKPAFYAYRMPIFLPVTRAMPGHPVEVWGCARPAHYAYVDTHRPQFVQIQFRPGVRGRFHTIRTVSLNAAGSCYFDVEVGVPASGTVRLAWSYPRGDQWLRDLLTPRQTTIHSRTVEVTIR
jgi:hypothetical protein